MIIFHIYSGIFVYRVSDIWSQTKVVGQKQKCSSDHLHHNHGLLFLSTLPAR